VLAHLMSTSHHWASCFWFIERELYFPHTFYQCRHWKGFLLTLLPW